MSVRTKEKKAAAPVGTLKKRSQLFEIWDRLRTNKLAMVGLFIVVVIVQMICWRIDRARGITR